MDQRVPGSRVTISVRKFVLLLVACVVLAPGEAATQTSIPAPSPGSTIGYPFIFDDFQYRVPVDWNPTTVSGSTGTLFGKNDWFQGSIGGSLNLSKTRAWYASYGWTEQEGVYHTTSNPYSITTNETGPTHMQITAQGNQSIGDVARINSGFSASTGTWVGRVRLPPLPDRSIARAHYSFWLQAPFNFEDDINLPIVDNNGDPISHPFNTSGTTWDEVNVEIGNWWDNHPAGLEYNRQISAGVTWAPLYSETDPSVETTESGDVYFRYHYTNDPLGTCRITATPGEGFNDAPTFAPRVCRDYLTEYDNVWTYIMMRVTNSGVEHFILARDEDYMGVPADSVPGFHALTTRTHRFEHPSAPGPMKAMFTLNVATEPGMVLTDDLVIDVDWTYYTPRTDLSIWSVITDVTAIRAHLWNNYNKFQSSQLDYVTRMNTTDLELEAPVNVGTTSCYPTWKPKYPDDFDIRVEGPHHNFVDGLNYFFLRFETVNGNNLRQTRFLTDWNVASYMRRLSDGKILPHTSASLSNAGYVYTFYDYNNIPDGWVLDHIAFDVTAKDWTIAEFLPECLDQHTANTTRTVYYFPSVTSAKVDKQPISTTLEGNYPNPFDASTTISYQLGESGKVALIVYDSTGREVARLVNGWQDAGRHAVTWDATGLSAGIYMYRLQSGDFTQSRRMLVVR